MSEIRGRVREYIEKLNRISVIILIAGTVISCVSMLISVILLFSANGAARPLLIAEELFNSGATIFLTGPIIAFILDMFLKSMTHDKE